jgi:hypothetical protein
LGEFLDTEVAGGLVLLAAAVGAVLLHRTLPPPARPKGIPKKGAA